MKKYLLLAIALFGALFGVLCFGQESVPMPPQDFLLLLIQSIGGLKGASALVIAGTITQLLIKALSLSFVDGWFTKIAGAGKLIIVYGLTLVSGVLALMMTGVSLGAALVHSTTLSALMVFMNEIYKHFVKEQNGQ